MMRRLKCEIFLSAFTVTLFASAFVCASFVVHTSHSSLTFNMTQVVLSNQENISV